jgi:transposase
MKKHNDYKHLLPGMAAYREERRAVRLESARQARALIADGMSHQQAAEMFCASLGTLFYWLRELKAFEADRAATTNRDPLLE